MSQNIDLKDADRKIFTTSFEDGLVDIFIASVVLMFAVGPFLSVYLGDFWSSFIFLPLWGVVYLILRWARKQVVNPRIGFVKYGPIRRKKLSIFTVVMLVLNTIFFVLGIFSSLMPLGPGWQFILPFGAIVLILFSLAGYFLDLTRLYFYGIMLALAPVVGELLYRTFRVSHHGFPIVFGLSAGIIFLTGLLKFSTLLHDNPLPVEELVL